MDYVVGFVYCKKRTCILLQKKNRPKWQENRFNGFGGKIENGETPEEAIYREFKEEVGEFKNIQFTKKLLLEFKDFNEDSVYHSVHFFSSEVEDWNILESLVMSANLIHDEKLFIYDYYMLPSNLIPNLRWIIPFILDSQKYDIPTIRES